MLRQGASKFILTHRNPYYYQNHVNRGRHSYATSMWKCGLKYVWLKVLCSIDKWTLVVAKGKSDGLLIFKLWIHMKFSISLPHGCSGDFWFCFSYSERNLRLMRVWEPLGAAQYGGIWIIHDSRKKFLAASKGLVHLIKLCTRASNKNSLKIFWRAKSCPSDVCWFMNNDEHNELFT